MSKNLIRIISRLCLLLMLFTFLKSEAQERIALDGMTISPQNEPVEGVTILTSD